MKKVFAILAITGVMVACNNSGESTEAAVDTTVTAPMVVPVADSNAVVAPVDSTVAK